MLAAVVVAGAAWTYWHLDRGWFPVDDGALAHPAERVLQGELPHRDFDDVYTGGLAMLNALAFRLLGSSFWSMRLALFALFVAWIPAVFMIARRFAAPPAAGALTLLAVVWSLPSYTAAMPSWYNLFLATFGVTALFRFLEEGRRRWLVAAGVAGGLSMLAKVVGLYYVAGVLLFLVAQARVGAGQGGSSRARGRAYPAMVTAALLLFVVALVALVRRQLHAGELVHFVMPAVLITMLLVRDEWRMTGPASDLARFRALASLVLPFVAGVALPLLAFLVPYLRSGAADDLLHGVFLLPAQRFGSATSPMLPPWTLLALLLPASLLLLGHRAPRWLERRRAVAPLLFGVVLVLLATGWSTAVYRLVWSSARGLLPALVVAGVLLLARDRDRTAAGRLHRARTMLLLCVTALCGLVQFPFSVAVYFCYVAPLVVLLGAALFHWLPRQPAIVPAALVALYLGFGMARVNGGAQYGMGRFLLRASSVPFAPLPEPRGGIRAPRSTAAEYDRIVTLLQAHGRGGYTWASPDSPEIYFLSGLRNPSRALYEFFEDTTGRTARTLAMLEARGVTALVHNRRPPFSPPLSEELVRALAARYPNSAEAGPYVVRWRHASPPASGPRPPRPEGAPRVPLAP